jgi:hypothetical protein
MDGWTTSTTWSVRSALRAGWTVTGQDKVAADSIAGSLYNVRFAAVHGPCKNQAKYQALLLKE